METKSPKSSAKKPKSLPQSSVDIFAAQCNDCSKWRALATEEEFEVYRSKQNDDPFVCKKRKGMTCHTPTDIEYDDTKTWVMDKPNIPKTPKGFKRVVILRKDYSKTDVQYITPDGEKIRAHPGIIAYLKDHPEYSYASPSDFSFVAPKVMADSIPDHVRRNSPASSIKKQKKST